MANNYPTIRPTLLHNYAGMGVLPPDVTFTRASQSGGYYDGRTVSKAEENLFINSVWAGAVSGTPGTVPTSWTSVLNGGSLAVSGAAIEFTALTGTRQAIAQTITVVAGQVITASIDVDAASGTGTDAIAIFEVVSGATLTGTTQILVSGGTGRKSLSATCTVGGTIRVRFGAAVNTNAATDCVVTLKAPQIEIRSFATAYTPTTTAPITNYIPRMLFAAANVPVFDHNPVTGEALGLSVWEARTNLLLRGQEFDNAYWTKSNITIIADQIIAPDGTLTADKYVPNAVTQTMQLVRTGFSSAVYVASIFAKAGELSSVDVLLNVGTNGGRFNLATGTATNLGSGTGLIIPVGNGWYRCIAISSVAGADLRIYAPNSPSYTGDGYSGIYIWGAQLEAGSFATPYIPTVASTVARSADVAVLTGVSFSRWYRADEGSFVAEFMRPYTITSSAGNGAVLQVDDGTLNNRIMLVSEFSASASKIGTVVVAGSATQENSYPLASGQVANTNYKQGFAYKVNDFAGVVNGGTPTTDAAGLVPVVTQMNIGRRVSDVYLSGYLKSLSYYPARLTNAQLQAVTA